MAIKMATTTLMMLTLVLASQWTCLHARSVPGDYDTAEHVPTHGGYHDPQDPATSFDTQSDMPSFAAEFDTPGETWDSQIFTSQDAVDAPEATQQSTYNYDSFASTNSTDQLDEGVFVDSPETVQTDNTTATSFAADTTTVNDLDEEAYFDTSSADTIYKANDK